MKKPEINVKIEGDEVRVHIDCTMEQSMVMAVTLIQTMRATLPEKEKIVFNNALDLLLMGELDHADIEVDGKNDD